MASEEYLNTVESAVKASQHSAIIGKGYDFNAVHQSLIDKENKLKNSGEWNRRHAVIHGLGHMANTGNMIVHHIPGLGYIQKKLGRFGTRGIVHFRRFTRQSVGASTSFLDVIQKYILKQGKLNKYTKKSDARIIFNRLRGDPEHYFTLEELEHHDILLEKLKENSSKNESLIKIQEDLIKSLVTSLKMLVHSHLTEYTPERLTRRERKKYDQIKNIMPEATPQEIKNIMPEATPQEIKEHEEHIKRITSREGQEEIVKASKNAVITDGTAFRERTSTIGVSGRPRLHSIGGRKSKKGKRVTRKHRGNAKKTRKSHKKTRRKTKRKC